MEVPYTGLLKYVGIPALIIGLGFGIYYSGYNNGADKIRQERFEDQQEQAIVVANLNGQIQQKEKAHAQETSRLKQELKTAKETYDSELLRVNADYTSGLRLSEQRAARYYALAQTGSTQCRGIASHAAGLDKSIVEGQSVVKELRATIELRDSQLRLLGSQIISDRQLYEDYGTDRN